MAEFCVIVDAYSAGNLLAPELKSRGYRCLHVQSTPEIWPIFVPTFRASDFAQNLAYDGDFEKLVRKLQELEPRFVLAGTETGVALADLLSERLGLPGNGTRMSLARRDKYLMVETCRKAGLRVANQARSESPRKLAEWFVASGSSKVVVKPLESAGTDKVAICQTREEVEAAASVIVGQTNMLGLLNREALVQEFLDGTEYFLNTVSMNGRHHFTDIWRYQKRSINGADCVYDKNVLCPSEGETERALQEYVRRVLDALEIRFGPAHAEVIVGPDGPALVEIGARLDGLSVPALNRSAVGYSPVDLTVDAYTDPEAFLEKAAKPYSILRHARTVYFTSYEDGEVGDVPGREKVEDLGSFFQLRLRVAKGSRIAKTTNYFTAPGFVSLLHENEESLESDYRQIRKWELERDGFFKVSRE